MTEEFIRKKDVYILKNALNSVITEETGKRDSLENILYNKAAESVLNMIEKGVEKVPAADVAPVIHAYWKPITASKLYGSDEADGGWRIEMYTCSRCNEEAVLDCNDEIRLSNYCPNCGAKMI